VHSEYQNYENGSSSFDHQQYCGEILERNGDYLKVDVKNRFVVGDVLELMTTSGNITFELTEILDKKGNPILEAKGSGMWLKSLFLLMSTCAMPCSFVTYRIQVPTFQRLHWLMLQAEG
jgi:hypothetical protein